MEMKACQLYQCRRAKQLRCHRPFIMNWIVKPYNELSTDELYAILRLRSEVFVVEQNCVFLDMDNKDQASYHLCGWAEQELAAYTRLVPPGVSYPSYPSIGRVVTSPRQRRSGLGRTLMLKSIEETTRLFGTMPIKIGAQLYLKKFYESVGFVQTSDVYLEDGIDHIEMLRES